MKDIPKSDTLSRQLFSIHGDEKKNNLMGIF